MKVFGFPVVALLIGALLGYLAAVRLNVKIPVLAP